MKSIFFRSLPCRVTSARTLLVILRFTVKEEHRSIVIARLNFSHIMAICNMRLIFSFSHFRICQDLAFAKSCHTRMLYLRLCEMALALFSSQYFKRNFLDAMINLASDKVANIRLKFCTLLPR